ncbi:EAL and GGDEF domain-containing protein [Candidatus Magnetaquicoccus inordinatus]|uniref:sensor domain-containing protein n=1 Tax=Candidatus Magnetaquicoccus inordinatus TaxID=2496818 RepID=UPI00187D0CA7|nr:EAL domain-containing protein [Candidatus Magnetaquicoccus inordinatus]
MNAISRGHSWRFLFAFLLPTLLIIPSIIVAISHYADEVAGLRRELQGIEDVRRLNEVIDILQQIRGLNQIWLWRGDSDIALKLQQLHHSVQGRLAVLRQELQDDPFQVSAEVVHLQEWSDALIHPPGEGQVAHIVFEKHSYLIQRVVDLRRTIMIRSRLALDADLKTTLLNTLVASELPDMEESIGRARGIGSALLSQSTPNVEQRNQFDGRLGSVRSHWERVRRNQYLIREHLPDAQQSISCVQEQIHPQVQSFLDVSVAILGEQTKRVEPSHYFSLASGLLQISRGCAEQIRAELVEQLQKRISNVKQNIVLIGVCGGLLWLLVTFIVFVIYRANNRAFAQIQASERKNQAILEAAVDGIVTIDSKGIIHAANAAVENLFGYPIKELLGQNVSILIPEPHRSAHDRYLQEYLKSGIRHIIGYTREVVGICKDGGRFPMELAVGEFTVGGESYFTGIMHDITERKKAKEALQEAYNELERRVLERTQELQEANVQLLSSLEAQKRAESGLRLAAKVFEHASEAIVITAVDGSIVDINQAYSHITGFSREDVIGANPRIGKSGRHEPDFYRQMWEAILNYGQWAGEVWDRRKNGEIYPKWLSINAVKDADGVITHFVGIFSDISHVKTTEERLEQLAFYDPLTRLPNRMLFKDRAKKAIAWSERHGAKGAVCFIDLDRFKYVNDTLGHAAGDKLLVEVARRLLACVRVSDTVARLGGDEFTVILTDLERGEQAAVVADKIIASVSQPVDLDGHQANIGASIGIAIFPDDGNTYDLITQYADLAMYHAKEAGRGTSRFFELSMNAKSTKRATLESSLRRALKNKEFLLHYQPKVELRSGRVIGMEALVRWQQPDGTMVSPLDFIPLAEETGLIVPLGQEILQMACQYNKKLLDQGLPPVKVAVNLSGRQFQDRELHTSIQSILLKTGLAPEWLELEVTESMMMKDERQAIVTLQQLREIGLSIAMDDFGTGYSSLSYLKRFPISSLKIDQSFVRDLVEDSDDAAIVAAIVSMAKSMRLRVVAEGVENRHQKEFLQRLDCDEIQGYWLSRPLIGDSFAQFLHEWQPDRLGSA